MSLSSWERQALDAIKEGLARSDPRLATLLGTFTRLASSEDMPAQEKITANPRRTVPCSQRKPRQRGRAGAGACACSRSSVGLIDAQWGVMLLWLVITVAMITVALVSNRAGGTAACTGLHTVC
jgi:hypothetical protein